jgi:D-aminopeptidase
VGETYDGALNDINGFHVKPSHVDAALAAASRGPVAEGGVGGGTGMICHEFKGGIGTASRQLSDADGGWTVGALVQANYGDRELFRVDGVPVGESIPVTDVPSPWDEEARVDGSSTNPVVSSPRTGAGGGSIIVILATDAPLLPHQCERLAQRAGLGLARLGSIASNGSGDLFLAFSTGNRGLSGITTSKDPREAVATRSLVDRAITPLFQAAVEATEAAVVNALLAAKTMAGRDGITAHALDHERLLDIMARYGRGPRST